MKIIKNIGRLLVDILITLLILLLLSTLFSSFVLKAKYVNLGGYTFFVVATGSMTGTIDVNDMVIVKITNEVGVNDIVTYYKDGYFVTHRVVSTSDDQLITKGDVNNTADEPITKGDLVGKVVYVFPFKVVFEVLSLIILAIIIIVMLNFETIFKHYIFRKNNNKVSKLSNNSKALAQLIKKVDCLKRDEYIDVVNQKANYSDLTSQVITLLKKRNPLPCYTMADEWLVRYRYLNKMSKLLAHHRDKELSKLLNTYLPFNQKHVKFDDELMAKLALEPNSTYLVLLMNAIAYQDEVIFDALMASLKVKLVKEKNN